MPKFVSILSQFSSCLTLGKLFNISLPQCFYLHNTMIIVSNLQSYFEE